MWRSVRNMRFDTVVALAAPLTCGALLVEASMRTSHHDADAAEACEYAETSRLVTAAHCRELERSGFVSIPAAMSAEQVARARADAQALYGSGKLGSSGNHSLVRQDLIVMVRESDDLGAGLADAIRLARGVSHALEVHNYVSAPSRRVPRQLQLSRYAADGASYGRHADACTDSMLDLGLLEWLRLRDYRERVITAILYLNSPSWGAQLDSAAEEGGSNSADGFGGELRCFHPDSPDGAYSDISPCGGTLVIFDSRSVEHEVRPSGGAERFALTSWIVSAGHR